MPARSEGFSLPRLLICEGPEDVAFFQQLIEKRNLPRFHVRDTAGTKGGSGGNTRFGHALAAQSANRGFHLIRDIVMVTDNDEDHDKAFKLIRAQVAQAGIGTPPDRPNTPNRGMPRITIITLPLDGRPGSLESICETAARRADRLLSDHIDHLTQAVVKDSWSIVRRDKFWLRCHLAGRARDPFILLRHSFEDHASPALIPVDDPSFNDIAAILAQFDDNPTSAPDSGRPPSDRPRVPAKRDRPRPRLTKP